MPSVKRFRKYNVRRKSKRSKLSKLSKRKSHRQISRASIAKMLKSIPRSRPMLRNHIKLIKSRVGQGRGSRLRGWSGAKPNTTSERRLMMQKCGAKCFLLPSQLKFPICPMRPHISCKPSQQGLLAAKIRAKQHKYSNVYKKAARLMK